MNSKLDTYTRRARLWPVLLVALPGGLVGLSWFPSAETWWESLVGLFVLSGGLALLAQLGRDWGKRKQPRLFESWGGKPTTRLLRHRETPNKVLLRRRHQKLQELLPDVNIPTAEKEAADPETADQVYETCVAFLLEKTRDKKQFPLVFEENCNYGFRRNLWGMKPLGIMTTLAGTIAVAVLFVTKYYARDVSVPPLVLASFLGNMLMLLGWLLWITPQWVKLSAEAYAERLLAACEKL